MKTLLRLEELTQFLFSIVVFSQLPYAWWWFPVLILAPDLSMIGYAINPRIGAYVYNLGHHKGLALALGTLGWFSGMPLAMLIGTILYGHSSLDRILGYGLKYPDDFKHTHLGNLNEKPAV
ncbi:protein of unknown function [Catalinimonas alkaloidigena]|uniref:DUF4260 domain-containing protein n=1 Tax=Catalinimonas alkaloidigena TaxID=1075417 RepID=A0A1G9DHL7_9BACT|nr:DUF4260 domain-containing protein [Catalinimonas alkaloidigena]SDK63382.1 protein of unknown function [Catalinimonas alkaloidigena]